MPEIEARLYDKLDEKKTRCKVCPHRCTLSPGQVSICGMRKNVDGKLIFTAYGEISSIGIDPVLKKPLNLFWPNHLTFSIASVGCNFRCPWCQNYPITQVSLEEYKKYYPTTVMSPEDVVKEAKGFQCMSISYTYNEPIIWYEYVIDTAKAAKKEGLMNILVTNGYITLEALEELVKYIDAANVDWKAFKESTYARYMKAKLEPVLQATEEMKRKGVHVEITYLVVPTVNDDENEFREMCKYIVEHLGPEVPLHISRFYPHYKFTHVPPTQVKILERFHDIAVEEGLLYVYVGNIPGHPYENTYCPECKKMVIETWGFEIVKWNLDDDNRCIFCGAKVHVTGKHVKPKVRPLFGIF
ncbi:MAG: AmmeMemoRadiSam system radical SAM enzyme [Thermoprotei archaeon]|nr:MAG: AmmeMemoRadiSam system radical SAM enzyme [Thermoprotei archaeon]RLF24034.1 MAG: AmmeMemoRadiSam system radical SAM enzyme [Thermoprotei archaeon]